MTPTSRVCKAIRTCSTLWDRSYTRIESPRGIYSIGHILSRNKIKVKIQNKYHKIRLT